MPRPTEQDKIRELMRAKGSQKRKIVSGNKDQLLGDLKKLKKTGKINISRGNKDEAMDTLESSSSISAAPSNRSQSSRPKSAKEINKANLPEGFFDSKEKEHKVKGTPKELEKQKEAEWKRYQAELAAEELRQEQTLLRDEVEGQVHRELEDAKFQIHLYKKADKLADKFEAQAAALRKKREEEHAEKSAQLDKLISNNFSSDESSEEETADWRARDYQL